MKADKALRAINIYDAELSKGIFYLDGDDLFWEEYTLQYFKSLVDKDKLDFNFTVLEDESITDVIDRINTFSFFGGVEVTIIKNIDAKITESQRKELFEVKNNQEEGSFIVFVRCKGLSGAEKAFMQPIIADKAERFEIIRFIQKSYSEDVISSAAINKLIDYTNRDMVRINIELKKLIDYAYKRKIEAEDIEAMVNQDVELKIYEFSNAVALKKYDKAKVMLDILLERGENMSYILQSLISQYRRIFHAKISPLSNEDLAKKMGVKPYSIKIARDNSRLYKSMQLLYILNTLKEREYAFKSGKTTEKQAFEEAISRIMI